MPVHCGTADLEIRHVSYAPVSLVSYPTQPEAENQVYCNIYYVFTVHASATALRRSFEAILRARSRCTRGGERYAAAGTGYRLLRVRMPSPGRRAPARWRWRCRRRRRLQGRHLRLPGPLGRRSGLPSSRLLSRRRIAHS
jgi:hypothetical protein